MTTLGDAPGGAELIASLTEAIEQLALLFAFTPDDKAEAALMAYCDRLEPEFTEAVGAETAAKMLDVLASAVMTEKHAIERGIASRQ
jgi:hypothetical protein